MPDTESIPRGSEAEFAPRTMSFVAPADIDLFDTHFEIGTSMHATFADTTQGFWESFPGSMDIQGDLSAG